MTISLWRDHVALVGEWLTRRGEIVDAIERRLLNVRDKELARSRDRRPFDRLLTDCFFGLPNLAPDLAKLNGRLKAAQAQDGLEPVAVAGYFHELDPLEL